MNKERYTLTLRHEMECEDGTVITLTTPVKVEFVKLPNDDIPFDVILEQLFTRLCNIKNVLCVRRLM